MTVHLVGAGPGDPELLTVRAARLVGSADAIVHDRLVGRGILDLARPGAELFDVGKAPGGRGWAQDAINALLVRLAGSHRCVVRLKGGDPLVFGRGGEEAEALQAAGIDVSVVPGVSAALAAPAAAGIPVTHRGWSSGFTVVTAHHDPAGDGGIDWDALARLPTTLVVLMGAARAAVVAGRLLAAGMAASTPVAVVTAATCEDQQTRRTTLDRLGAQPVRSPAVIVIGAVAALDVTRSQLWSELAPVLAASGMAAPVLEKGVPA